MRERLRLVEVYARAVEPTDLEDQRLFLGERSVACECRAVGNVVCRRGGGPALAVQHDDFLLRYPDQTWRGPASSAALGGDTAVHSNVNTRSVSGLIVSGS